MTPIFMEKGTVFQNRFGVYKHDDIIGKEYGSKVIDLLTHTIKNILLTNL